MLDLYVTTRNATLAYEDALRIANQNALNFQTPGYKYTFASFTTLFNQVLTAGDETVNPQQTGGGMALGATKTDFTQGSISLGTTLDAAINGEGLFILSRTAEQFDFGSNKVYTRNGSFQVDFQNRFLVDDFGRKVFGLELSAAGNVLNNNPVPIETKGFTDIGWTDNGVLVANFEARRVAIANNDPNPPAHIPLYQLILTDFPNQQGLILENGAAYSSSTASGEPLPFGRAEERSFGEILPQQLESSNVDVARVALDLAQLNRGFNAVQGIIDDINRILSGLIQRLTAS